MIGIGYLKVEQQEDHGLLLDVVYSPVEQHPHRIERTIQSIFHLIELLSIDNFYALLLAYPPTNNCVWYRLFETTAHLGVATTSPTKLTACRAAFSTGQKPIVIFHESNKFYNKILQEVTIVYALCLERQSIMRILLYEKPSPRFQIAAEFPIGKPPDMGKVSSNTHTKIVLELTLSRAAVNSASTGTFSATQ